MSARDHPFACYVNRLLFGLAGRSPWQDSFTFADALSTCGSAPPASWALFFLVKFERLEEAGGYKQETRYKLVNATLVAETEWDRLKPEPKAPAASIADVAIEHEVNDEGRLQVCAIASCRSGDGCVSSWGDGPRSVKRSLTLLSQECSCKAKWHQEEGEDAVTPSP